MNISRRVSTLTTLLLLGCGSDGFAPTTHLEAGADGAAGGPGGGRLRSPKVVERSTLEALRSHRQLGVNRIGLHDGF